MSASLKEPKPNKEEAYPFLRRNTLEIREFDPSKVLYLRGEIHPDKGKPSNVSTREFSLHEFSPSQPGVLSTMLTSRRKPSRRRLEAKVKLPLINYYFDKKRLWMAYPDQTQWGKENPNGYKLPERTRNQDRSKLRRARQFESSMADVRFGFKPLSLGSALEGNRRVFWVSVSSKCQVRQSRYIGTSVTPRPPPKLRPIHAVMGAWK